MTERIFDGIKVIDCASFIAGPAAATVMSDFGAEVIKIEPPGMGDPYRRRAVPIPGRPAINPGFVLDSRNKKSLALDLRTEAGRAVLYRLVRGADVFITNYPPPVRQRLRITYDDLAHLNERLIYASFTGYGETGPEASKPGFDATAWWARTGLMHLVRAGEEATPARSLPGMGDHPVGDGHLRRDRHRAVSARAHRQGQLRQLVIAGERAVGQWLLGAGGAVRRSGGAAAAARGGGQRAARALPLPLTGAGCCCRSRPTNGAGTSSRRASPIRRSTTRAMPASPPANRTPARWCANSTASSRRATSPIGAACSTRPG